jgi:dolichol-phosphate mannosyltransferase
MIVVVLASYNESSNIKIILDLLKDYSVILVDDNSPDGTAKIAKAYKNVKVIIRRNERGIASAYLEGFKKALEYNPEYIIQMDCGLTHEPASIPFMINVAKANNAGLVINSRFLSCYKISGYRSLISLTAAFLFRQLGIDVTDATTGFRCWKSETLQDIIKHLPNGYQSKGFAFQLENLYLASRLGYKIAERSGSYMLTNSSFKFSMLKEALIVYLKMLGDAYENL